MFFLGPRTLGPWAIPILTGGRDGRLFRVDFGFAFGRTPEIDAPGLFVPNAVYLALGEARWRQVCGHWLESLLTWPMAKL